MSNRNNFFGLDRFIWWMGVVVNNKDPLEVGRCQIRIFGWHSENKDLVPDNELPWAMPIYPPNAPQTFSVPNPGLWAVGFFLDGESGQNPVFFGTLPYIVTKNNKALDDGFNPQLPTDFPKPPTGVTVIRDGESSVAPLGRNVITGSGIDKANKARIAVGDVVAKAKMEMSALKKLVLAEVAALRTSMEALFSSSLPPGGALSASIKSQVTALQQQVNDVKKYTDSIKEYTSSLTEYQDYLNNLIKQIQELPAEAQALQAEILKDAQSSLSEVKQASNAIQSSLTEASTVTNAAEASLSSLQNP